MKTTDKVTFEVGEVWTHPKGFPSLEVVKVIKRVNGRTEVTLMWLKYCKPAADLIVLSPRTLAATFVGSPNACLQELRDRLGCVKTKYQTSLPL
jgi:hypothetical protein